MDDELGKEVESVKNSVAMSRLVADMAKKQDTENRRLWAALCAALVALVIAALCMVSMNSRTAYMAEHMQESMNEAVMNALGTMAEMEVVGDTTTTTTTQSAEGDNITFNNVEGEQFNDNAQKAGD